MVSPSLLTIDNYHAFLPKKMIYKIEFVYSKYTFDDVGDEELITNVLERIVEVNLHDKTRKLPMDCLEYNCLIPKGVVTTFIDLTTSNGLKLGRPQPVLIEYAEKQTAVLTRAERLL